MARLYPSTIHPTAIIEGDVDLADEVTIGPGSVIDGTLGRITIRSGSCLIGNVYLYGPLTIGTGNTLYPGVCLGFAPQSLYYDPGKAGCGLVIGNDNTLREGVTIHRAMTDEGPTSIGNNNYLMCESHAGHDARVGDHCTFANGVLLGGHVIIDDRVTIGGNATIHQFCRVGRGAMLSGSMGLTRDLPPFFMLTGTNYCGSLNLIGMRRQGLSTDDIENVRWVYKMLYRRRLPPPMALEVLKERMDRPLVAEYVEFLEASRRGLCPGHHDPRRQN
ncbi:MAG: acyl-ACP--UDP-N-acetylglucosamine O-acyltransferase [Planctomycetota bacterium]|jgi:UDP-N-acetylglucosamine acyltransferase